MRLLGTILNSPGFCDEETLLYLAQDLEPVEPARHGEEERYIEVVEVALADVDAMIALGRTRRRPDRARPASWPRQALARTTG